MEIGAVIISIVAVGMTLAVGGFAIWLQWLMSRESTKQLGEAQQVLSKLEGVSLQLRDTQEKHFSELLNAVVGMVKKDTGEAATRLEDRVAELESSGADYEKIKEAVEEFKRDLEKPTVPTFALPPWSARPSLGGFEAVAPSFQLEMDKAGNITRVEDSPPLEEGELDEEDEDEG